MHTNFLLLPLLIALTKARFLHSLPDDPHAFPKFRVVFLNNQPVLNSTAERWLAQGLSKGEPEFLEHTWTPVHSLNRIEGGGQSEDPGVANRHASTSQPFHLERMSLGPKQSYICLVPKPIESPQVLQDDDFNVEINPARSWSLLQPLTGTCLYHRQGWFTYSYCHNHEMRQFKELIQAHPTGSYKPEEDPEWESYTLGKAPPTPVTGADLTVAEQHAQAANLELARNAGSRYLVQRWGDGTICDKTGKHREVEVQFHCSMVMTDNILFVKEAKTCSYVLVVHTPRLCGEPGFRSRRDSEEEALIRCREVVNTLDPAQPTDLPEDDHPLKFKPQRRKAVPPATQFTGKSKETGASSNPSTKTPLRDSDARSRSKEQVYADLVKKALESMLAKNGDLNADEEGDIAFEQYIDDGDVVVDFLDDVEEGGFGHADKLVEALRAAGFDVRTEKIAARGDNKKGGEKKDDKRKQRRTFHDNLDDIRRDEL